MQSLSIGVDHTPTEINPLTTDSSISANLINLIFDPLLLCSAEGKLLPNIVREWTQSSDGLVWKFTLRNDVEFHDHHKLTSEDVRFTYNFLKNSLSNGHSNYLNLIKEIIVKGDYTIEFVLKENDNFFQTSLCEFGIAPKSLLEGKKNFSEFNKTPIGSGPYKFVSQDKNSIILEKNEDYFMKSAFLDRIEIKIYDDQKSVLNHLIRGDVDMSFLTNPEDYGALSKIPTIKIYDNWYPRIYILGFNNQNPLFQKSNVRRAISLAINKSKFVSKSALGKSYMTKGTLSPDTDEYLRFNFDETASFSPQESLRLLKSEGWEDRNRDLLLDKNGKKFEFTAITFDGEDLALKSLQYIQSQLRNVGILMKVKSVPFDKYIETVVRNRDFEAVITCFVSRPFYNNDFSFWHSSQMKDGMNFFRYKNEKVDDLLSRIRTEISAENKISLNFELQNELLLSPPGAFLFWRKMPIAVNSRFEGVPEKRMQNLRDLIYFKVKP